MKTNLTDNMDKLMSVATERVMEPFQQQDSLACDTGYWCVQVFWPTKEQPERYQEKPRMWQENGKWYCCNQNLLASGWEAKRTYDFWKEENDWAAERIKKLMM